MIVEGRTLILEFKPSPSIYAGFCDALVGSVRRWPRWGRSASGGLSLVEGLGGLGEVRIEVILLYYISVLSSICLLAGDRSLYDLISNVF